MQHFRWLAELLNAIETRGLRWPAPLCEGHLVMIPKGKEAAVDPIAHRPLTIMNLAYRVWSTTRVRQASGWMRSWAPARVVGGLPGCGPEDIWGEMSLRLEIAKAERGLCGGVSADLWKFYDLANADLAVELLCVLGMHKRLATAILSF